MPAAKPCEGTDVSTDTLQVVSLCFYLSGFYHSHFTTGESRSICVCGWQVQSRDKGREEPTSCGGGGLSFLPPAVPPLSPISTTSHPHTPSGLCQDLSRPTRVPVHRAVSWPGLWLCPAALPVWPWAEAALCLRLPFLMDHVFLFPSWGPA